MLYSVQKCMKSYGGFIKETTFLKNRESPSILSRFTISRYVVTLSMTQHLHNIALACKRTQSGDISMRMHGGLHLATMPSQESVMVMNGQEANEKSIMGLRVHVLLISPGETETEDVIVEEVTRSHARASFLRDVVFFFFSPLFLLQSVSIGSTNTQQHKHTKAVVLFKALYCSY